MKKIAISLLILFTLILTACGASNATPTGFTPNNNSNNQAGNEPLPIQVQILVGTFKLEKTDNAVTSSQAAELLPLWQVYKSLSTSDNAAQQEVDAVVSQIQETMTPDQMKAIADMKLTRRDLFTTMQDLGITFNRPNASGTPQPRGQGQGNFPPGGFQGGGGSGGFQRGDGGQGGQGFNNGQSLTPAQIATAQARRAQGGGFNRIPPGLMDALIQLLQTKASS